MPTTKQRVTINLSEAEYAELAGMAEKHNLSMAWIGHKAIVEFIEQSRGESLQLPLTFPKRQERSKWPANNGPQ
jgi:hypothetical protein